MSKVKKKSINKKLIKTFEIVIADDRRIDTLYRNIVGYIRTARSNVLLTVNTEQVRAYWLIGRDMVEEEQAGKERARYGAFLLEEISLRLTKPDFKSNLGWVHYRALMRDGRVEARSFYELEASKNNWSGRELERQMGSFLFDRLAKSRDKKGLLKLSCKGQEIIRPEDAVKEPLVLEFLGLPEGHKLVESKLEEALISNMQNFLLELGRGFAFVARQKRITLDGDHFYADLVFYHTVLKAFVILDLKVKPLTHADLGQMQLYVNYFDMEERTEGDNPTIGLILCAEQNKKMVKYFLGDKTKNIFASKYQLHLPTEKELEEELKKEIKDIKHKLSQIKNA
ncbi:MAG: DUF1016 family protein [Gammaproteobacteria bacterium]|nr:DUF1016 family protein [Gammaproteobacteria bacterium]